ncbi:MAG: hypothetical protein IKP31_02585 [Lachnospiraceae bacterium]|nr:hypothetical protein [Lachnospiraceae bacterium]
MQDGYSFKIIDETRVPLSAGVADYSGIATVIVLISILLALCVMYLVWFRGHKKRIAELCVMGIDGDIDMGGMDSVSIFHPIKTMRFENELENQVVSGTAKGV